MISGATRGQGLGDALARHLTDAENDEVVVVPARGLASMDLAGQIRELVAISMGGRTDRPVYHVHADPDPGIADAVGARALFWSLFETEFGLRDQPYCGVEHVKGSRRHEHRVYGLVRPDGSVVDLAWDYPRREKCSRIVEHAHGMPPVPSKHARAIERRLRAEGIHDVADWLVDAGATTAARPIAPLTPTERLIQDRTGIVLDDLRRTALAAWRASDDATSFVAALRARGLDLREGRVGAVIVDATGTAHLATRVIGAAARRFEGERIPAADVRARLASFGTKETNDESRNRVAPRQAGQDPGRHIGGAGAAHGGDVGLRRPGRGVERPHGGGLGRDRCGSGAAFLRLQALPPCRSLILHRHLGALDMTHARLAGPVHRARSAADRMNAERAYEQRRAWLLWGKTDIWGIPLT